MALGAPDTIVTNFAASAALAARSGSSAHARRWASVFWCYSGDTGACTAAYLHVSAATPWIAEASQSLFRWQIGDVIEGGPFR